MRKASVDSVTINAWAAFIKPFHEAPGFKVIRNRERRTIAIMQEIMKTDFMVRAVQDAISMLKAKKEAKTNA